MTLRIYTRHVTSVEERKIISNAANKTAWTGVIPTTCRQRAGGEQPAGCDDHCGADALTELNVDKLMLCQKQGFQCVMPTGFNLFRDQFERELPASNVLVDFNCRADDKTNANILILGNSGQGDRCHRDHAPETVCWVGITDQSDFDSLAPEDYPILSDLYAFMEEEYKAFDITQR